MQGKIGLEVSDDTVNRAHWVGKKEEGANRTIIVCLNTQGYTHNNEEQGKS